MRPFVSTAFVTLALVACSKPSEPVTTTSTSTSTAQTATTASPPPLGSTSVSSAPALSGRRVRPEASRVVAIGDLHGDLGATMKAFALAGAIDGAGKWIGKSLVVVQTGDEIDRGDDDRAILDRVEQWKADAKAQGGELIALVGNHELMNVDGDFRYVTPGSSPAFGDRTAAFSPHGTYAQKLAERPVVVKVGDTVFVHGGVIAKYARSLDAIDDATRDYFLGARKDPPREAEAQDGPLWSRVYSDGAADCAELGRALSALGAKRMIVGHTVQKNGITSACDDKVYRIDTGMTHVFGGPIQVLELAGGSAKILELPMSGAGLR